MAKTIEKIFSNGHSKIIFVATSVYFYYRINARIAEMRELNGFAHKRERPKKKATTIKTEHERSSNMEKWRGKNNVNFLTYLIHGIRADEEMRWSHGDGATKTGESKRDVNILSIHEPYTQTHQNIRTIQRRCYADVTNTETLIFTILPPPTLFRKKNCYFFFHFIHVSTLVPT